MRLSILLFTCLFTLGLTAAVQPGLAQAQRYKAAKTSKAKTPRAQARTLARAKARASYKRNLRLSAQRFKHRLHASIVVRKNVRAQRTATKSAIKAGQLTTAAVEASRSPLRNAQGQFTKGPKKISMRERFALWRGTRAVKRSALKQAKKRSAAGDVQGTVDALQALNVLEAKGKLGVIGRWKKAKANKRAFRNSRRSASKALKTGDLETAGQNFALASELSPGARTSKKMASKLVKQSFSMASEYAKTGNTELTWSVLEMGAGIAHEGGVKFSDKKAQKIVDAAFVKALPALTKAAEQAYKSGNFESAVASLAEARAIASSGTAKPSRRVRKKHARLARKLGPRLQQFEQAQAQAQQQQALAQAQAQAQAQ